MQSIVFANRCGKELAPLNEYFCPAMLPIVGKPVLEHCLEELKCNNVNEVFLVIDKKQKKIRDYFENGFRWGLRIHYIICKPQETPDEIKYRIAPKLTPPFLAVRGDILRGIKYWNNLNYNHTIACVNSKNQSLGALKLKSLSNSINCIGWPLKHPQNMETIYFENTPEDYLLKSISSFHRQALNVIERYTTVIPNGLPQGVNLMAGKQSKVHHSSLTDGAANVGDFSFIDETVQIFGRVSIGHQCIIDQGVRISNSVILDKTYIGASVELNNAIVCQNKIIRVDLGVDTLIKEPFILAKSIRENHLISKLFNYYNSFLLLILVILTIFFYKPNLSMIIPAQV